MGDVVVTSRVQLAGAIAAGIMTRKSVDGTDEDTRVSKAMDIASGALLVADMILMIDEGEREDSKKNRR